MSGFECNLYTVNHENGTLRLRIVNDPEPYDTGDHFTRAGTAGMPKFDAMSDRELAQAETNFLDRLADNGGPWGFIVEHKCPACGEWQQVDSCWGFGGDDSGFAKEQGIEAMSHAALRQNGEDHEVVSLR